MCHRSCAHACREPSTSAPIRMQQWGQPEGEHNPKGLGEPKPTCFGCSMPTTSSTSPCPGCLLLPGQCAGASEPWTPAQPPLAWHISPSQGTLLTCPRDAFLLPAHFAGPFSAVLLELCCTSSLGAPARGAGSPAHRSSPCSHPKARAGRSMGSCSPEDSTPGE